MATGEYVLGDTFFKNITMGGSRCKEEMKNGSWDSLIQYCEPEKRPEAYSRTRVLSINLDKEKRLEGQPPIRTDVPAQPVKYISQEDGGWCSGPRVQQ
jgi:hypothetical protein